MVRSHDLCLHVQVGLRSSFDGFIERTILDGFCVKLHRDEHPQPPMRRVVDRILDVTVYSKAHCGKESTYVLIRRY